LAVLHHARLVRAGVAQQGVRDEPLRGQPQHQLADQQRVLEEFVDRDARPGLRVEQRELSHLVGSFDDETRRSGTCGLVGRGEGGGPGQRDRRARPVAPAVTPAGSEQRPMICSGGVASGAGVTCPFSAAISGSIHAAAAAYTTRMSPTYCAAVVRGTGAKLFCAFDPVGAAWVRAMPMHRSDPADHGRTLPGWSGSGSSPCPAATATDTSTVSGPRVRKGVPAILVSLSR